MASAAEANSEELESLKELLAMKIGEHNTALDENGALTAIVADLRAKMASAAEANSKE